MLTKNAAPALAIMALAILAGCGGAQSRYAAHMARGQEYYSQDNFAKAGIEFRNARQIVPNDPQALFMVARVAEKLGNIRGAAQGYEAVIEMAPSHWQARAALGRLYVLGGAAQKGLDVIAPAFAQHPDDAELLTVRASARMQLGDRPGALQDAERAVQLAPRDDDAAATLAGVYSGGGEVTRAIEFLAPVVASRPESVALHQVLAALYETAGDTSRAEHELREMVRLKPHEFEQRAHLAAFEVRAKRLDEAERVLSEAIQLSDDHTAAKLAYLNFLASYRSPARAEQALAEFVAREPDNYALQIQLGAAQRRQGATDEATKTFTQVIQKAGEQASGLTARNSLALIYLSQGRREQAQRLIDQVLAISPRDTAALGLRADMALERGDATAAIADLRAVLRDEPNSVQTMRTLAAAYRVNHELPLAEEILRSGLQAQPGESGLRTDLARLYATNQRSDEAISLLREGVQATPQDVSLREALVDLYMSNGDLEAARTVAADLEKQRPDASVGPYLAGVVAMAQKRNEDAERDFNRALQLQPSAMDALSKLARLEFSTGRKKQAFARCAAEAARDPQNARVRNLMGELYLVDKDFANAVAQLTQATQLSPKWPIPYRNLALTELASGDRARAASTYEAGVAATGLDPGLVNGLATVYLLQRRVDDAIHLLESLHAQQPDLAMAANNLAVLLVSYKTDKDSLDRARLLSEPFSSSSDAALLDTNGWVRLKCGDPGALPVLERAASLAPSSRVILYHLGMAQLGAGQRSKARASLEASVADGASFMGADEARAKLAGLKEKAG